MHKHLVFSDLDGTLLNHHDYNFEEAKDAILHLNNHDIPLILTTSKTFFEVLQIQQQMGFVAPFIVENGSGIFMPPGHPLAISKKIKNKWTKISDASSYSQLRHFFKMMQHHYPIRGFADMTCNEIMSFTNLDAKAVKNAMQRDFTEPFIIKDKALIPKLRLEAQKAGFDIVRGGRFFHLISKYQNKAAAMQRLSKMYGCHYNWPIITTALGDSQNDLEMIQQADTGVVMPRYDGSFMTMQKGKNILYAKHPGAKGWNQAVKEIFHVK